MSRHAPTGTPSALAWRKLIRLTKPGMWSEIDGSNGTTITFHQVFVDGESVTTPTGNPLNPHKLVFEVPSVGVAREKLKHEGTVMFEIQGEDPVRCDGLDVEGHQFQLIGAP
tara:strand:- start:4173 stop:4508 length:336 start_codon:yes stop_codon:yes gene_type:complete